MTSPSRKMLRKQMLDAKKSATSELNMFDRLPDKCDTCHKDFDKKSKEMAKTWFVVVKKAEKVVRLFCPDCMGKAKEVINASEKHETPVVQEDSGV